MIPRQFLRPKILAFIPLLLLLFIAISCGGEEETPRPVPTTTPVPQPTPVATPTPRSIVTPVATPTPTSTPAPRAEEPRGKLVISQHWVTPSQHLDPQENLPIITQFSHQYALHDALAKNLHGQASLPSLAESYEISPDMTSATFVLRKGTKFHNLEPITAEDVKWNYENYRGALSDVLKSKTDRVELLDDRTVRFHFKGPFLDFGWLYTTMATGSGWIVPAKYYQQVGKDGFKAKPVGAGPYKLVRQEAGVAMDYEAFTEYWRTTPKTKTINMRMVLDGATRLAMIKTQETDIIYFVNQTPGHLEEVMKDPKLTVVPNLTSPFFIEFPGWQDPKSPFHDVRVREAVSLALDRRALTQAETGGYGPVSGNWIPAEWLDAIEWPELPYDLAKAKELMAQAGYRDGITVDSLTPFVSNSLGERVIGQLREVGIKTKLQPMEPAAMLVKLGQGATAWPGTQMIISIAYLPGNWYSYVKPWVTCKGVSSRTCVPEIEAWVEQYEKSVDVRERQEVAKKTQTYILENYLLLPLYRNAFITVFGPRIANKWQEIFMNIPQYAFLGPYEDVRMKE